MGYIYKMKIENYLLFLNNTDLIRYLELPLQAHGVNIMSKLGLLLNFNLIKKCIL